MEPLRSLRPRRAILGRQVYAHDRITDCDPSCKCRNRLQFLFSLTPVTSTICQGTQQELCLPTHALGSRPLVPTIDPEEAQGLAPATLSCQSYPPRDLLEDMLIHTFKKTLWPQSDGRSCYLAPAPLIYWPRTLLAPPGSSILSFATAQHYFSWPRISPLLNILTQFSRFLQLNQASFLPGMP